MLRKFGLATTLVLAGLGSSAAAEEHYILMMGAGYFPDAVHPAVGDTLRFVNTGSVPMAATATDGSWTTSVIQPGAEVVIAVTDGMKQTYTNILPATDPAAGTAGYVEDGSLVGVIDYLNPPNTTVNTVADTEFVYPES